MKTLSYKGYTASLDFDIDGNYLYGRIQGINDVISFDGETPQEAKANFEAMVDQYLDYCKSIGKDPDKSYSGTFNIRTTEEIHRKLSQKANEEGVSLNKICELAFAQYLDNRISAVTYIVQSPAPQYGHVYTPKVSTTSMYSESTRS